MNFICLFGKKINYELLIIYGGSKMQGPDTTFVAAEKERSADGLHLSLESISWGKEPLIGSGGHFDLLFFSVEVIMFS
jgi:hypothetical protein